MKRLVSGAALALTLALPASAQEKYLGEIMLVGFNFCPLGSAEASGQLLSISENSALFALLGTTYGGDGRTTFALPDLRGRVIVGEGAGPGLSPHRAGDKLGAESVTQNARQLAQHNHGITVTVNGSALPATTPNPAGALPALTTTASSYGTANPTAMAADAASATAADTGGGEPMNIIQPSLVMRYCVVTSGIFPSRQ